MRFEILCNVLLLLCSLMKAMSHIIQSYAFKLSLRQHRAAVLC